MGRPSRRRAAAERSPLLSGHPRAHAARPIGPLGALGRTLAVGAAWYAFELALVVASGGGVDPGGALQGWIRLLPWQLAVFLALGAGLAALTGVLRFSRAAFGWLAVGGATFVFVGARVAEGAIRSAGPGSAAVALLVLAGAVAALLGALAAIVRLLPPSQRLRATAATWVSLSVLAILFARRAGPAIALGEVGARDWPGFVSAAALAAALGAGALVFAAGAFGARRAGSLLLAIAVGAAVEPRGATAEPIARPDVIVVLLDTLRADHVGPRAGAASATPVLDAIAAEGVQFRRAYSPANLTRRAMPGLLASSTERVVGVPLAPTAGTLPMWLRDAGWSTVGVSSNPFVSAHYGYERGFERFSDPSSAPSFLVAPIVQLLLAIDGGWAYRLGLAGADLYYEPANQVFGRGLRMLRSAARPSFAYLHAMDVHGPYLPPRRLLPADYRPEHYVGYSRFLRLEPAVVSDPAFAPRLENVRQRYLAGVRAVDEQLGALRDALVAEGRWDESLVWITSDHGEALGEQGLAGHGLASLMPALIHVPLVVKPPRSWRIAPRVVDEPVSTLDLAPTTLALLGLPVPPDLFGESLEPVLRAGAAAPERDLISWNPTQSGDHYSVIRGRWQLALQLAPDGTRTRRLFDLATDPAANADVAASHPEVVAELEPAVDRQRAREERLALGGGAGELDAATRERLRALGYVDDGADAGP